MHLRDVNFIEIFQGTIIPFIFTIIFITIIFVFFSKSVRKATLIALIGSIATFSVGLGVWVYFDSGSADWQFYSSFSWLFCSTDQFSITFGVDGISLFFVLLTLFITPLCILAAWNVPNQRKSLLISILIIEFGLIGVFTSLDLLLFFIFFELILPPMFFLIGIWGSRRRRIKANYYFVLYTLFGSIFMLFGILLTIFEAGSTSFEIIMASSIQKEKLLIIWVCFFIGLAVKIPMIPLHIWLPEAHVEAPTIGSVILASLLLKMGGYGFIRILLFLFPSGVFYFLPLVNMLGAIGVFYASCTAILQTDLKRIIAYSSIAHMNFAVLGLFSLTVQGIQGSILLMLGHGLVSGGLFFIIGMIYDRFHTKQIKYFGGLARVMPIFSLFFLFFLFSNIAFPGTSNFVGELLTFVGIFEKSLFLVFISLVSTILTTIYSIWLYNRVAFGELKTTYLKYFSDLTTLEFNILLPLVILILLLGLYPDFVLNVTYTSVKFLVEVINNS